MTLPELIERIDDNNDHGFTKGVLTGSELTEITALNSRLQADAFGTLLAELRLVLDNYPAGRERSLVATKLDEAELWMTKVRAR